MKKIIIANAALNTTREANANEYPIRMEPKSAPFTVRVNDVECRARSTSGKGKSAINNHYFYFIEGEQMFYVRTTPDEIAALKAGEASVTDYKEPVAAVDAPAVSAETPKAEPKARRKGKATAEA